jgi:hypothetical protein
VIDIILSKSRFVKGGIFPGCFPECAKRPAGGYYPPPGDTVRLASGRNPLFLKKPAAPMHKIMGAAGCLGIDKSAPVFYNYAVAPNRTFSSVG